MAALGRPTLLSGYGGTGKSLLAADLALAVAAGRPASWGGVPIALQGRVAWLDYEMGGEQTGIRLKKLAAGSGAELGRIGECWAFGVLPQLRLTDGGAAGELERIMSGRALLVLDSLRASADGDEQDSRMRRVLDEFTRLTEMTGCAVLVLVHETKTSEQTRGRSRLQAVRGSGAIADAASCVLSLTSMGGTIEIAPSKSSWGPLTAPHCLRLVDDPGGGLRIIAAGPHHLSPQREPELSNLAKALLGELEAAGPRSARALRGRRSHKDVKKALQELEQHGRARQVNGCWELLLARERDVPRPTAGEESR